MDSTHPPFLSQGKFFQMVMCRIILMAWFWPFITQFMKNFACGGLTISFTAWYFMKKGTVKSIQCCRRIFFRLRGGNPQLIWKIYTSPPLRKGNRTTPSGSFDLVHLWIGYLLLVAPFSCDKTLLELLHNSVFGLGMGPCLSQHDNLWLAEGHKSL